MKATNNKLKEIFKKSLLSKNELKNIQGKGAVIDWDGPRK